MNLCVPQAWQTSGGIALEKNAWDVVRSSDNTLVVAGPGAGKTELLAQRACYLLQANICPNPMRILAISFKRDAAHNLRDRVEFRCSRELSARFDSFTFDAFAKNLVDRFREGLPHMFCPAENYDVETDVTAFADRVTAIKDRLQPPPHFRNPRSLRAVDGRHFVATKLSSAQIDPDAAPTDVIEWGVREVWRELIAARPCVVGFGHGRTSSCLPAPA